MAFSSLIGSSLGVLGLNLVPGLEGTAGNPVGPVTYVVTSTSSLSITNPVIANSIQSKAGASTLVISDTAGMPTTYVVTGSNAVVYGDDANNHIDLRSALSCLGVTQSVSARVSDEFSLTGGSFLTMTQPGDSSIEYRTALSSLLDLSQSINYTQARPDSVPGEYPQSLSLTGSTALSLTNSALFSVTPAAGIKTLTGSNSIVITNREVPTYDVSATSTVALVSVVDWAKNIDVTSTMSLDSTVVPNLVRSPSVSSTLGVQQYFTYLHTRNGVPVPSSGKGACKVTETYSPYSGGGATGMRQAPPAYNRHKDVEFYYPAGRKDSATETITLRAPNFGDRSKFGYDRVNRETRGGVLRVYRDPQWPDQRTMQMDFSGIKDSEVDTLLSFIETTLGQEIGLRDWQGRQWKGIIMNPDAGIVRHSRNGNDLAIELEVEAQNFVFQVDSNLVFSDSNSEVVL